MPPITKPVPSTEKVYNFALLSVIMSIVIISALIYINSVIARAYLETSGKSKALFGLVEFFQFSYKYVFVIPGLLSLWIATISYRANELRLASVFALILSLLSIILVFVQIWKFMI